MVVQQSGTKYSETQTIKSGLCGLIMLSTTTNLITVVMKDGIKELYVFRWAIFQEFSSLSRSLPVITSYPVFFFAVAYTSPSLVTKANFILYVANQFKQEYTFFALKIAADISEKRKNYTEFISKNSLRPDIVLWCEQDAIMFLLELSVSHRSHID